MAQLLGKAAVYGITGTLAFAGQVVAQEAYITQDQTLSKPFAMQELVGQNNEVVGYAVSRKSFHIQIDVIPIGGTTTNNTIAQAKLALDRLPSTVTKVTITDSDVPSFNGDYMYLGDGSARLTQDGYAVMSLPLLKYSAVGSDATTLSTVVA